MNYVSLNKVLFKCLKADVSVDIKNYDFTGYKIEYAKIMIFSLLLK